MIKSMIPKSGYRFSEKIMLPSKREGDPCEFSRPF
jgi:hypothetical protein